MSFWKWFRTKFHSHEWEVIEKVPLQFRDYYDPSVTGVGTRFFLQCKICGDITHRDCK